MSYLNFSISILENYTDKSIHQIALLIVEALQNSLNFRDLFELTDAAELEIGSVFLQSVEAVESPEYFPEDFLGVFINFPDVCFCLSVLDDCDDTASDYRLLFFNGKSITQCPEIRYPEFHVNDFEYEASEKITLEPVPTEKEVPERMAGKTAEELYDEAKERIDMICNMIRQGVIPLSKDSAILNLIRKNLYGDIIAENSQDA